MILSLFKEIGKFNLNLKSSTTNLEVVDEDLDESVALNVLGLLVGSITNAGHEVLSLEPPPHPVINTLGLPPVGLSKNIAFKTPLLT